MFRWTMTATGTGVLNFSQLGERILSMLIKICEYFPSRCVSIIFHHFFTTLERVNS